MKKRILFLFAIIAAFSLVTFSIQSTNAATSAQTVNLRSRKFVPKSGLDAGDALQNALGQSHWYGMIQLVSVPDQTERDLLETGYGITLLEYIPTNTWLARLPTDILLLQDALKMNENIFWIGELTAEDKLSPDFDDQNFERQFTANGELKIQVLTFLGSDSADIRELIVKSAGTIDDEYSWLSGTTYEVSIAESYYSSIAQIPGVKWVAPEPPPARSTLHHSREAVGADLVTEAPYDLSGAGVTVAAVELGHVRTNNVDVDPIFWDGMTEFTPRGHATSVAVIMTGDGDSANTYVDPTPDNPRFDLDGDNVLDEITPNMWRGYAPSAQLLSMWRGDLYIGGAEWVVNESEISNHSYTNGRGAFDDWVYGDYGRPHTAVTTTGNWALPSRDWCRHDPNEEPMYATATTGTKNGISVGAIRSLDREMELWSGRGPGYGGVLAPHIVAPGITQETEYKPEYGDCRSPGEAGYSGVWTGWHGWGGTSFSAPAVSGSLALMLEDFRNVVPLRINESWLLLDDLENEPLPSTLKALLLHNAEDIETEGPDYISGYGILGAHASVEAIRNGHTYIVEGTIADGETLSFDFKPQQIGLSGDGYKVTLVWDDVPASQPAGQQQVNDIDLEIVQDFSQVFGPWILNPTQPELPAVRNEWNANTGQAIRQNIDNVEQVYVPNTEVVEDHHWRIKVIGANIPEGPQSFSLVFENYVWTASGAVELTANGVDDTLVVSAPTPVTLAWTTNDLDPYCDLFDDATGAILVSGYESGQYVLDPTQPGTYSYSVDCEGDISDFSDSISVEVTGPKPIGEAGTVSNSLTHEEFTVVLQNTYDDPVVFAMPLSINDSDRAAVRITNVRSNSFTMRIDEPPNLDGQHPAETVSYLVIERGDWLLEDGTRIVVDKVNATATVGRGITNVWESIDFGSPFNATPVILSQVQTNNDAHWVHTRQRDATVNGFDFAMEEEEGKSSPHGAETIGFIAMDVAEGDNHGLLFEANLTSDSVKQFWYSIEYTQAFSSAPVFLGSIASYDGTDPVHLRYLDNTGDEIRVRVEEDQVVDGEIAHTTEIVSYLAIENGILLAEEND